MNSLYSDLKFSNPARGVWRSIFNSVVYDLCPAPQTAKARRAESKADLELRQAALFALRRSLVTNDTTLEFAMVPVQDDSADTVLRTGSDETIFHYERVQLKEVVPDSVDYRQSLQGLLENIARKFGTGEELTIAIHLNRDFVTTLGAVRGPNLPGVTFWLFGICDQNRAFLVQNPFARFQVFEFDILKAPSDMTKW